MAAIIQKSFNILRISAVHFAVFAIVGAYVRSCDATTSYCGQALYLWEQTPTPHDFITTAQATSIIQLITCIAVLFFSSEWLDYERIYGISLLVGVIAGGTNVIYYWVIIGDGSVEAAFVEEFGSLDGSEVYVGIGTISSGIIVLIQLLLLFFLLLTGGNSTKKSRFGL